jgi:predicted RNase H-like HicB family nuclease
MVMEISIVLEGGEDGMIVAHCPALKSCWSQGRTRDEALQNIREAIELYLEADEAELPADEEHEVVKLAI